VDAVNALTTDLAHSTDLRSNLKQTLTKCELINQLLIRGQDLHYASFNNIVEPLMTSSLLIVVSSRAYLHELVKADVDLQLMDHLVGLESKESYQQETTLQSKRAAGTSQERQILYENHVLWLLKLQRLCSVTSARRKCSLTVRVHALDHFVRREIAKKISQERLMDDMEAQVYNLPFKMKVQSILEDNKALDEITGKDKEKMAREAEQEIEVNFPSYFDEFQRQLLSLSSGRTGAREGKDLSQAEHVEVQHQEVPVEHILGELTEINSVEEDIFRSEFLRLRLEVVQMCQEQSEVAHVSQNKQVIRVPELLQSFSERDNQWTEDAICCLED